MSSFCIRSFCVLAQAVKHDNAANVIELCEGVDHISPCLLLALQLMPVFFFSRSSPPHSRLSSGHEVSSP